MEESFPAPFGRYRLIEKLAVGGMAEVFLAEAPGDHGFAKRVVIKRLLPQLAADETYQAMFIDEAKLTARLVHPKIAQTFDMGTVGGQFYIAMEYIEGADVLALLREFAQRRRRVEPHVAAWIAHEVLDALEYAHHLTSPEGVPLSVVHRDISPSNILMSMRGDIKLVDFGIARQKDPSRAHQTKSGTLKGKYGYMSPEQVVELPLDGRSDVFSVGVVLAELLMGRRLFAAANELDVLLMVRDAKLARFDKHGADVSPRLQEIVRKGLRKNVEERWSSAGAFRDAIAEWLFEQRLRMTPKVIAEIVADVRQAQTPPASVVATTSSGKKPGPQVTLGAAQLAPQPTKQGEVRAHTPSVDDLAVPGNGDRTPLADIRYEQTAVAEPSGHLLERSSQSTDGGKAPRGAKNATLPPPMKGPAGGKVTIPRAMTPHTVRRGLPAVNPGVAFSPATKPQGGHATGANLAALARPEESFAAAANVTVPRAHSISSAARNLTVETPSARGSRDSLSDDLAMLGVGSLDGVGNLDAVGSLDAGPLGDGGNLDIPSFAKLEAALGSTGGMAPVSEHAHEGFTKKEPSFPSIAAAMENLRPVSQVDLGDFDDLTVDPGADKTAARPASKPAAPPALAEIVEPPDDAGDFSQTAAMRVLFRLMVARATGLLVVSVGGIKKEIYIRDGQPEYVSSNVASELFGNYLVSRNVLSDGELAMALAMVPHYGGKLGDTLVGLGLLKPLEVFRHLTRQVRSKIVDVCTWTKGNFWWYSGRENPREAFPLDFNAFEILGTGAMSISDDVAETWLAQRADARIAAARSRRVGPERFEVKGLVELFITLDGKQTVAELVDHHADRNERMRLTRMLFLLEACELIREV